MTEYDELVRALLVERYRPWPSPPTDPNGDAEQLAAALVHEKRRPAAVRKRTPKRRGLPDETKPRRST